MLAFTNADEKTSPTIIGAGCKLTGDIKTDHSVQIHGHVVGDIVAEIKESQAKLQDYKEHIRTVKGIINCPHCGQELSPDAAFCSACGHRLENENTASSAAETERTCPNCNAPMPEDFLFCIECGTPYPQEEPCTEETAPACEEGTAAETETESDRT